MSRTWTSVRSSKASVVYLQTWYFGFFNFKLLSVVQFHSANSRHIFLGGRTGGPARTIFFATCARRRLTFARANIEGGGVCWLLTSAAWPPPSQLWSTFYRELATRFNTYISTECYRNFTIYVYPFLKKILFLRWKDEDSNLAPNCWEAIPSDVRLRKMRHTVSSRKLNAL